jgi:hypothetical protein
LVEVLVMLLTADWSWFWPAPSVALVVSTFFSMASTAVTVVVAALIEVTSRLPAPAVQPRSLLVSVTASLPAWIEKVASEPSPEHRLAVELGVAHDAADLALQRGDFRFMLVRSSLE